LHVDFNTTEAQRQRLLGYMRKVGSITTADDYPVQPMQIPVLFTVEVKDPSNFVFYNQFLQDLESVLE